MSVKTFTTLFSQIDWIQKLTLTRNISPQIVLLVSSATNVERGSIKNILQSEI